MMLLDDSDVVHKQVASKDPDRFECSCGKIYTAKSSLERHFMYYQGSGFNSSNSKRPRSGNSEHRENDTDSSICPFCSELFFTSDDMQKHLFTCKNNIDTDNIRNKRAPDKLTIGAFDSRKSYANSPISSSFHDIQSPLRSSIEG
jgi:hypothetical protein